MEKIRPTLNPNNIMKISIFSRVLQKQAKLLRACSRAQDVNGAQTCKPEIKNIEYWRVGNLSKDNDKQRTRFAVST